MGEKLDTCRFYIIPHPLCPYVKDKWYFKSQDVTYSSATVGQSISNFYTLFYNIISY